eukprot:TRINITY_DN2733_c0_g1_i2.p1 TRINITY_DN2733_c0_g1~~TRINITY_DN2733_c0_g1_i2.p1  ORF type:complete len:139 (+),score=13.59 TRINITY_DN2733_c0_g1_i2:128-544(+)
MPSHPKSGHCSLFPQESYNMLNKLLIQTQLAAWIYSGNNLKYLPAHYHYYSINKVVADGLNHLFLLAASLYSLFSSAAIALSISYSTSLVETLETVQQYKPAAPADRAMNITQLGIKGFLQYRLGLGGPQAGVCSIAD